MSDARNEGVAGAIGHAAQARRVMRQVGGIWSGLTGRDLRDFLTAYCACFAVVATFIS
ncbi:MAG TPA: hypothetical protein VN222_14105 [Novosphingobium sp.]|nr:hypothetical protein [Novosphingobium sp.]